MKIGYKNTLHICYNIVWLYFERIDLFLELLQAVHKEGSKPGSMFAPVQRLTESSGVSPSHPSHGFKRDLVRLIANMTYQNATNQDTVRIQKFCWVISLHRINLFWQSGNKELIWKKY